MTERLIKNILSEILFGTRICENAIQSSMINTIYEELMLEKLLVGEPITVPELRDLLHNKILNFEFVKLDGNVRPAKGTTMMKYVPKDQQPTGENPSSDKVAAFYDLDKGEWRSVSNKSKEIILKKDEETGKPKVVVSDKKPKEEPDEKKMIPKEKGVSKRPITPVSKPVVKPSIVPKEVPPVPKVSDVQPEPEEEPLNIEDPNIQAANVDAEDIYVPEKPKEPKDIDSITSDEVEIPDRADITFPDEEEKPLEKEDITFPEDEEEENL